MAKVAAVIQASDSGAMERRAREALSRGADLVELRLDALRDLSPGALKRLANSVGPRAIATLRSRAEGGTSDLPPERRRAALEDLVRLRFRYVDLERTADEPLLRAIRGDRSRRDKSILVSQHFARPADPAEVSDALDACAALGDVAKVAAPVEDLGTAVALADLARKRGASGRPSVVIGMGTAGMLTRALADAAGQEIQYAAVDRPSAPGQFGLATALRLRGQGPIVLGLVGHPLAHSISPAIHEAAFAAAGVPAVYLPFDVERGDLGLLLDTPDRLRLRGFNVTIPHKEAVAPMLDELDGDAEALGAVNTVVVQDGWTKGHNTDVYGFRMALRSLGLRVGGRPALVVGAGGAARAVVHVLLREGARVSVANRTPARAEALADAFDDPVEVLEIAGLASRGPWGLLVNATSAGTKGVSDALPVPEPAVARAEFVMDLVYNPPETPLLRAATRAGVRGASGLGMLLHQAAQAFELWLGRDPPFKAMEAAAREALA
jgi:shikimate dehydrogenase/3-dehydroquinate dehydratase type I